MSQYKNFETNLINSYYGNVIDNIVFDNPGKTVVELQCMVSETIENLIKEDLSEVSEGYVSELIAKSYDNIDYEELVKSYIESNKTEFKKGDFVIEEIKEKGGDDCEECQKSELPLYHLKNGHDNIDAILCKSCLNDLKALLNKIQ